MSKKIYQPNWIKIMVPYFLVWLAVCTATWYAVYVIRLRPHPSVGVTPVTRTEVIAPARADSNPQVKAQVQIIKK